MTSDAKIGLLLALLFIVAIAFVINGLPLFSASNTKTEPQKDYFDKYKYTEPGLVGSARKVAPALNKPINLNQTTYYPPKQEVQNTIRYKAILPKANEVVETTGLEPKPMFTKKVVPILPKTTKANIEPKRYIVQPGDNLAYIAKKFYGDELGNKLMNIEKIFKANSKTLKSQDELFVGQKLIIPGLDSDTGTKISLPDRINSAKASNFREYTVKEDDSLWAIASKLLGNGNRYKEIAKLNSGIIKNEDNLAVGMRLRLPK